MFGFELSRRTDTCGRLPGWPAMSKTVARRLEEDPGTRLLTHDPTAFCEFASYAGPRARPGHCLSPSRSVSHHYALAADLAEAPDGKFLLASDSRQPESLSALFARVRELDPITVPSHPDMHRQYRGFRVQAFRGFP